MHICFSDFLIFVFICQFVNFLVFLSLFPYLPISALLWTAGYYFTPTMEHYCLGWVSAGPVPNCVLQKAARQRETVQEQKKSIKSVLKQAPFEVDPDKTYFYLLFYDNLFIDFKNEFENHKKN